MIDSTTTRILALLLVYSFSKWCAVFTICTIYRLIYSLAVVSQKNLCNMSDVIPIDSDVRSGVHFCRLGRAEGARADDPSPITFKGLRYMGLSKSSLGSIETTSATFKPKDGESLFQAFICCAPALPHRAPPCSLSASPCMLPRTPSLLPLKRPCSLSWPRTAISNPKFGVDIIYILALHHLLQSPCTVFPPSHICKSLHFISGL